ncbi:MAG: GAF domain-containing protein [Anaerolineae bacterium]|nr:GAF domain-containing protein [Anaerolineae bacterium]
MTESPDILKWRIHQLTQLVNVSLVLNSTLAIDPLLRFIMDSASQLVGAEGASILLYNTESHELVFTASSTGSSDSLIGQPVPLEGSIAGTILRENRAIAISDVSQDARHYRGVDEITRFHTRSLLGVPMRMRDQVVGVLEAVNKVQGEWTVQDRSALMILAAQAAVAIDNARLVAALRQANEELSDLDQMKNDFIAIASHELRTPLGIILGYASFLRDSAAGEASAHADAVFRSALQLRGTIEQLTNLRYLKQRPDADLVRDWVAVSDLLLAAEMDIRSMAEAKAHQLVLELPPADPQLYVDGLKLQSVLSNLLNNAVRFTPPGGTIRLGCQIHPQEVWIQVQDSGPGIAPEDQERIFNEFVQVENHLTRRHGGMGLGLSIARALVQAHAGRLWVESPGQGQGATFILSLPRADQDAAMYAAR